MHFMTAGDAKYYSLIRENCAQLRTHYPDAPVLVYDFGLAAEQQRELRQEFPRVTIIDWRERLNDLPDAWEVMPEEQKRKLALAFNARETGWRKRLRKAIFKRFSDSSIAAAMKHRALRFENMMIQKIACMRDASGRVGAGRLVFLDADAMLFKPIEDAFDDKADVTLTLLDVRKFSWDHNACFVINSGVIFFGSDEGRRNAFLDAWWAAAQKNDEWLREQSALVRLVEKSVARDSFRPGNLARVDIGGSPVRVRFVDCAEFNFFDMENVDPDDFPDARIYHFTGRRQQPAVFAEVLAYLRARR